jgi:regulator of extracellular matrix RemA (YlzA/DUF370 family)
MLACSCVSMQYRILKTSKQKPKEKKCRKKTKCIIHDYEQKTRTVIVTNSTNINKKNDYFSHYFTVIVTNSTNINKKNDYFSHYFTEYK